MFEEVTSAAGIPGGLEQSDDRWVFRDTAGDAVGWAGEVVADGPSWAAPVFGFEVWLAGSGTDIVRFDQLPSTPAATRDLALRLPDSVSAAQIDVVIQQCGGRLLESAAIFDEFHGKEAKGRSVAWRLVFRAPNRTLRDAEVDAAMTKILEGLERQLGVERR